mgnify:CR=1 FL=1
MRVSFDEKADALYIRFDESGIVESEEVKPGIVFDFDDDDRVVGIEILHVSKSIKGNNLKKMQFDIV